MLNRKARRACKRAPIVGAGETVGIYQRILARERAANDLPV